MADEELDGIWRTIMGRKVFIKDGQSLQEAMEASGKFEKGEVPKKPASYDKVAKSFREYHDAESLYREYDDLKEDFRLLGADYLGSEAVERLKYLEKNAPKTREELFERQEKALSATSEKDKKDYEDFHNKNREFLLEDKKTMETREYIKNKEKIMKDIRSNSGVPSKVADEISKFNVINKSPYSNSFYNTAYIDWGYKAPNSIRISDHWNFTSRGEQHCRLEGVKEYTEGWKMAQYNEKTKSYKILKEWD